MGCAHHKLTFSVWSRFSYLNWVVLIVNPTVAKQLLHHSWDWWFVTAKTTCFSIMCSENWYHQHIPGWVPFTPSYLQTNQKSALNDHGNKDTGDKLYCISVSAQIHQCKGSRERFLPKFRPCQYNNRQRATRLTQTRAMAPTDMQMLTTLMFIYLLRCLIPPLQTIQK